MKVPLSFIFFFLHTYLYSPGQDNPGNGNRLTLLQAIQRGEKNYPLLKSKSYEVDASRKNIDLSKNSFVPNLDFSYQANLATANNITGMFYPQGNVEAAVHQGLELMRNGSLRESIRLQGRAHIEAVFSTNTYFANFMTMLHRLGIQ